ncbi:MAG: DNA translocase FtsK 4TM domain-containing protein, partial [Pseudomonadota bacterium]
MARKARKRSQRLVENETEQKLRRGGAWLIGLVLFAAAAALWALLWSYNAEDPSLFSATSNPPTNWLGLIGASLADPLHRVLGWAAYGFPVTLAVWGVRLMARRGDTRVVSRIILAPIAIVLSALFAGLHVPLAGWPYAYGLGGVMGDAVLREVVPLLPLSLDAGVKLLTLALGLLTLLVGAVALGTTWTEARAVWRWMRTGALAGIIGSFVAGKAVAKATGQATAKGSQGLRARKEARAAKQAAEAEAKAERFNAKVASEASNAGFGPGEGESEDDARVMARITRAVQNRTRGDEESGAPALGGAHEGGDAPAPVVLEEASAPAKPEPRVRNPERRSPPKSARAQAEEQPQLNLDEAAESYELPPLSLLSNPTKIVRHYLSDEALEANAKMLESVLDDYGVKGEITSVRPGPVVTMYELEPAAGLKASRVIGLADDIARSMSALAT